MYKRQVEEVFDYELPTGDGRTLILIRKISETPEKYPSDPAPLCPVGQVRDGNALGLELVAQLIGQGKVLGLFRIDAALDQRVNGRVALAVDEELTHRLDLGGLGLAHCVGLGQQVQAQDPVKVADGGQLRGSARLGLEGVVDRRDGCLLYTSCAQA